MIAVTDSATPATLPAGGMDHLSHSQIQTFLICPRKWRFDKIDKAPCERRPATLLFGSAVHEAVAAINLASLEGGSPDGQAIFRQAWSDALAGGPEVVYGAKDDAGSLLAKGLELVSLYRPPPGVIGVEQPFSIHFDDLPTIEGRIDIITQGADGSLGLWDVKTSATRSITDTTALEMQLGLYDLAYPAQVHRALVLAKLKEPCQEQQDITICPPRRLERQYRRVHHAMVSGVDYINPGWHCATCPFRDRCRQETGKP